ncbi:hypothetical protein KKB55_06500 [Myxococcota bacterium]|nr:hypothetical protein [Myxococcota bacterium]
MKRLLLPLALLSGCALGGLDGWSTPDQATPDAARLDMGLDRGLDGGDQGLDGGDQGLDGGDQGLDGGDQGLDGGDQGLDDGDQGLDSGDQGLDGGDQGLDGGDQGLDGGDQGLDGCAPPLRAGHYTLQAQPDGDAEAWFLEIRLNPPRVALTQAGATWVQALTLPPGDYPYRLCRAMEGDEAGCVRDRGQPYTQILHERGWEGVFSRLRMPDLQAPTLEIIAVRALGGVIEADLAWARGRQGAEITAYEATLDDAALAWPVRCGRATLRVEGLSAGRHTLRATITDAAGRQAAVYAPIWLGGAAGEAAGEIIYYVVTDRARAGALAGALGGWHGGGFEDITAALDDLQGIGVTTICLTAVVTSTEAEEIVFEGHTETAYHGFWPTATGWPTFTEGVEAVIAPRFGGVTALRALTQAAHARGLRIIADLVIDQAHLHSPLVVDQDYLFLPRASWPIEYLPRFDFERTQALELVVEHATALLKRADLDGFRPSVTRALGLGVLGGLRARLSEQITGPVLLLGGDLSEAEEDDAVGAALRAAGVLDLQLDGRAYGPLIDALITATAPLSALASWRPDPTKVSYIGNHDFTRPLSLAAGQTTQRYGPAADAEGWTGQPAPAAEAAYARLRLALTALYTRPGPLLLYYGDELGLEGVGRPANRAPLPLAPNAQQRLTRERLRALARLRAEHPALWSGDYAWIALEEGDWAAWRLDEAYWVILRREGPASVLIPGLPFHEGSALVDLLTASPFSVGAGGRVALEPWSAVILTEAR